MTLWLSLSIHKNIVKCRLLSVLKILKHHGVLYNYGWDLKMMKVISLSHRLFTRSHAQKFQSFKFSTSLIWNQFAILNLVVLTRARRICPTRIWLKNCNPYSIYKREIAWAQFIDILAICYVSYNHLRVLKCLVMNSLADAKRRELDAEQTK